jgi:geranylgeranyl diphosphate synthase type II
MPSARPDPSSIVDPMLALARDRTRRVVLADLPRREPRRTLYDIVAGQVGEAGKGLRPAVCIATCQAFGGQVDDALPFAAALELLHAALLVHDDIEDASQLRRGKPTLHVRHGLPLALNAGDALAVLATQRLVDAARPYGSSGPALVEHFHDVLLRTIEGQAKDLGWRGAELRNITEADYLEMVFEKTALYSFVLPMRLGAAAAGCYREPEQFHEAGFYLGGLFQVRDDLENLWPNGSGLGKVHGEDVSEGKVTLLTLHLHRSLQDSGRRRLLRVLGAETSGPGTAANEWVVDQMERLGSRAHATAAAAGLAQGARRALPVALEGRDATDGGRFLTALVDHFTPVAPAPATQRTTSAARP